MYRVTETGWPVTGATTESAVASVGNAQKFWRSVACQLFQEGKLPDFELPSRS